MAWPPVLVTVRELAFHVNSVVSLGHEGRDVVNTPSISCADAFLGLSNISLQAFRGSAPSVITRNRQVVKIRTVPRV